jgi:hypothetical protein
VRRWIGINGRLIARAGPTGLTDRRDFASDDYKSTLATFFTTMQINVILRNKQFAVGASDQIGDVWISIARLRRPLPSVKNSQEIKTQARR